MASLLDDIRAVRRETVTSEVAVALTRRLVELVTDDEQGVLDWMDEMYALTELYDSRKWSAATLTQLHNLVDGARIDLASDLVDSLGSEQAEMLREDESWGVLENLIRTVIPPTVPSGFLGRSPEEVLNDALSALQALDAPMTERQRGLLGACPAALDQQAAKSVGYACYFADQFQQIICDHSIAEAPTPLEKEDAAILTALQSKLLDVAFADPSGSPVWKGAEHWKKAHIFGADNQKRRARPPRKRKPRK